jgi:hypothetical protein
MSAYPYEDLASAIADVGLVSIALGAVVYAILALVTRRRLLPIIPATLGAFALLVLVVLMIVRVHWYAGAPNDCFFSDNAIDSVTTLAPLGFVAGLGALFVARAVFDGRARKLWSLTLVLIACALGVRWVHVVTLDTYSSADATISRSCHFDI